MSCSLLICLYVMSLECLGLTQLVKWPTKVFSCSDSILCKSYFHKSRESHRELNCSLTRSP